MNSEPDSDLLWSIGTLVVWAVCVGVGVLGLYLGYPGHRMPAEAEIPPTQIVDAKLTLSPQPTPPPEPVRSPPAPSLAPFEPPAAAPPPPDLPASPPVVAVAPQSPAISFALPTEGLTRIVDAGQAGYTRSALPSIASTGAGRGGPSPVPRPTAPPAQATAPPITHLSLDEGEGQRIRREYPREALLAQQEGTVGVRFTVEEDGHVSSAQVISPSRWPVLNQGAARDVRESLFAPGARRVYEVSIEFHINR